MNVAACTAICVALWIVWSIPFVAAQSSWQVEWKKNAARWKKLTYLADYEDAGAPKPGATVLASLNVGLRKMPLLVTQSYGHGRTAVLATGGTWRWQMSEALGDPSHDLFWNQLLR